MTNSATPVEISLEAVSHGYGDRTVLDNVGLQVASGQLTTLLGASGSGKTTCLRLIAGFLQPSSGSIRFDDVDVSRLPVHQRDVGFVFQSYALFPHLDVARNVAFGLRYRNVPRSELAQRVNDALALVKMEGMGDRLPAQLSGGQKQRVALARAVAIRPKVLLLDEPLAALDANLREELQGEIRRVQRTLGITTVLVTHDQKEAMAISDRIAILREGKIAQEGTPLDLYRRPTDGYVARFLGAMNLLDVEIQACLADGSYRVASLTHSGRTWHCAACAESRFTEGERAQLAFRAEAAALGDAFENVIEVSVRDVTYAGHQWDVVCGIDSGPALRVRTAVSSDDPPVKGPALLSWPASQSVLLRCGD